MWGTDKKQSRVVQCLDASRIHLNSGEKGLQ